jgi:AAA domain
VNPLLRPIGIATHPVARKRYRIPTPAIAAFHELVQRCVALSIPGAIVYARTRFGKTSAIVYSEWLLKQEHPTLPVLRLRVQHKRIASEIAFFSSLLSMAAHQASSGRDPTKLRQRLTQRLLELADTAQSPNIVLFLDEAQHLTRTEFEWLRDVYDEMDEGGINLVIFFVGQPALKAKKSLFQRDGEEQIVARFMTEELHFPGLLSADDCATCLQGYDLQEYQADSGWTHTRFFLPQAYAAGLRLAREGDALWRAFDEEHKRAQLPGALEIPMEYFARAVQAALLHSAPSDNAAFAFSAQLWEDAVTASGYRRARLK